MNEMAQADPKPLTVGTLNQLGGYRQQDYGWRQPHVAKETYANRVEIERGEHDATLRFYRDRGNSGSLVQEITVPLALLGDLVID